MDFIIKLVVLLFSVILHEYAHGWMAERRGDGTARAMGRLTFNPVPHIDPIGTIILPLFAALVPGAPVFGWAKPVPVNPYNLDDPRRDMIWVSLAGPGSNLLLAVAAAIVMAVLRVTGLLQVPGVAVLYVLLQYVMFINVILPVFNLFPIPPLDGSKVVMGLLPSHLAYEYGRIEPYGFLIVILLLSSGILWGVLGPVVNLILGLLTGSYF